MGPMTASALARNLVSFSMPLMATVLVPGLLLGGDGWTQVLASLHPARAAAGALLMSAGLAMLAWTVTLFIRIGRGTLAPWDPTRKLVVRGPYAHVRNPMISGVLTILLGEALAVGASPLWIWAALFLAINHVYFIASEEPGLAERFGAEYDEYRRAVPRWIPRPTAWRPPHGS